MNPWSEKLGCEVNVCNAKLCDAEMMKICALRKAYQERVAYLKLKRSRLKHNKVLMNAIDRQLKGLGYDRCTSKTEQQD